MWLFIGFITTIIGIIVAVSYIEVKGQFMKNAEYHHMQYEIKALLGMIRLKFEIPVMKFKGFEEGVEMEADLDSNKTDEELADVKEKVTAKKALHFYHDIQRLRDHVYEFSDWVSNSLSRIKCTQFRWVTIVGTGDAPSTAVTTGLIWSVKSTMLGYLSNKIKIEKRPDIRVEPQFNNLRFTTDLVFIIKVRNIHSIFALLLLVFRIIRVKGGLKVWMKTLYRFYLNIRDKKKRETA